MSASRHRLPYIAAALIATLSMFGSSLAATGATKDEAVAMVKKAVADRGAGQCLSGDHQSIRPIRRPRFVYGLDGMVLAHGANANRVGTNQIADTDPTARRS